MLNQHARKFHKQWVRGQLYLMLPKSGYMAIASLKSWGQRTAFRLFSWWNQAITVAACKQKKRQRKQKKRLGKLNITVVITTEVFPCFPRPWIKRGLHLLCCWRCVRNYARHPGTCCCLKSLTKVYSIQRPHEWNRENLWRFCIKYSMLPSECW